MLRRVHTRRRNREETGSVLSSCLFVFSLGRNRCAATVEYFWMAATATRARGEPELSSDYPLLLFISGCLRCLDKHAEDSPRDSRSRFIRAKAPLLTTLFLPSGFLLFPFDNLLIDPLFFLFCFEDASRFAIPRIAIRDRIRFVLCERAEIRDNFIPGMNIPSRFITRVL